MKTKYLIMEVKNSIRKVLNVFSSHTEARKFLSEYKEKLDEKSMSMYIKQVSVY